MGSDLLCKRRVEASLVVLFGADEARHQHSSQTATDVTRSVLCVLLDTVLTVPVSLGNGRQLGLDHGGRSTYLKSYRTIVTHMRLELAVIYLN